MSKLVIRNSLPLDKDNGASGMVVLVWAISILVMVVSASLIPSWPYAWFILTAAIGTLPFSVVLYNGVPDVRFTFLQKLVWETYRNLPKELGARVGKITDKEIENMPDAMAEALFIKLEELQAAYNLSVDTTKFDILESNITEGTEYYREFVKTYKELGYNEK